MIRYMVRDYTTSSTSKWRLVTIKAKIGPKTYYVDVGEGGIWKRHACRPNMERDALKPRQDRKEEMSKFQKTGRHHESAHLMISTQ